MNKRSILIIFFSFYSFKILFAFDGVLELKKNAFVYQKYNFYIDDVIDARPNKERAIGHLNKLSGNKLTVGNENLGPELRSYFFNDTLPFNKTTKIILVINQVNFADEEGCISYNLGFDYYRIKDNMATLIYSQFENYYSPIGFNTVNDVNKAFSSAMEKAFLNFKKQLWYYKPILAEPINISELKKAKQVFSFQIYNLKEGLYFNINQIYSNSPALASGYNIIIDTLLAACSVLSIKSSNYLVNKSYAFVKKKQLYFYWKNNYYPAKLESDSNLYLKHVRIPKVVHDIHFPIVNSCKPNAVLFELGLILLFSALVEAQNPKDNYFSKDIKIDSETGQLN